MKRETELSGNDGEGELCFELQIRRHFHIIQMHLFFILF